MVQLIKMSLVAVALMVGTPVIAKTHCTCTNECATNCAEGKTDDCKCKKCGCSKGKGCKHGKCESKHKQS